MYTLALRAIYLADEYHHTFIVDFEYRLFNRSGAFSSSDIVA